MVLVSGEMMENTAAGRLGILESRMCEPFNGPKPWPRASGEGQSAEARPTGGGRQMYGPRLPRLNSRVT